MSGGTGSGINNVYRIGKFALLILIVLMILFGWPGLARSDSRDEKPAPAPKPAGVDELPPLKINEAALDTHGMAICPKALRLACVSSLVRLSKKEGAQELQGWMSIAHVRSDLEGSLYVSGDAPVFALEARPRQFPALVIRVRPGGSVVLDLRVFENISGPVFPTREQEFYREYRVERLFLPYDFKDR